MDGALEKALEKGTTKDSTGPAKASSPLPPRFRKPAIRSLTVRAWSECARACARTFVRGLACVRTRTYVCWKAGGKEKRKGKGEGSEAQGQLSPSLRAASICT